MGKAERIELIKKLQTERGNSFVITYLTSTRQGLDFRMSMDIVRKVYEHLTHITDKRGKINIDLYLYSNGGDGTVPWRLVTLIREFTKKFSVIVPCNAFSAATLTALGANEVVMHSMGMLGPTDATVGNLFNPDDTKNPGKKLGISVEDVISYISLIKEDVGITHEDELVQAFNKLPDHIHPLALGNVKRSLAQSRMLAKKLLTLHMDKKKNHDIDEIVDNLTSKLYYHGHPINRIEAKEIGLGNIIHATTDLEKIIWDLYLDYEKEMQLTKPFNPSAEFISKNPTIVPFTPTSCYSNSCIYIY